MHNVVLALSGAWRVLLASLALGAGLPMLFAVGVRALSLGTGGEAVICETGAAAPPARQLGRFLAGCCFAVVLTAVVLGITFIVASGFGKTISFGHVYPMIVDKH